jgi:hypothetical protein
LPALRQKVQKTARQQKRAYNHEGAQRFETALVLLYGLFMMKNNLAGIYHWSHHETIRIIFALGCWAMEPTGCGNIWLRVFPRPDKYWTISIVQSISTRWPSCNTGGEKSQNCLEWVESTITRLFYAEVDNVIWGL